MYAVADISEWIEAQQCAGRDPRDVLRMLNPALADQVVALQMATAEMWNIVQHYMLQFLERMFNPL